MVNGINNGRFKKGSIPWNKGKKYNLKHDRQFKKGSKPWNKKEKVELICGYCGKKINVTIYYKNKKRYCSKECYNNFKKISYKGEGNPFYGKKHNKKTRKKMSESWNYNKHINKKMIDKLSKNNARYWLGKKRSKGSIEKRTITRKKNGFWKDGEKVVEQRRIAFTGKNNPKWKGGISRIKYFGRYGDDWNKIRLLIYQRDNYSCRKCGIKMNDYKKPLDIHHKIPFTYSFDNSLINLITLCRSCHMKEERKIEKQLRNIPLFFGRIYNYG